MTAPVLPPVTPVHPPAPAAVGHATPTTVEPATPAGVGGDGAGGGNGGGDGDGDGADPVTPLLACAAAALATSGAAWMLAGVFAGPVPRLLALAAALAGPAAVAISTRSSRPAAVQTAGLAVLLLAAVGAGSAGRSGGLLDAVAEALRSGGLADGPVAFEPGWRVVLVAVVGLLGMASAGIGAARDRPRLAVAVAAPAVAAGALVQPEGGEVLAAAVALALTVAALGVGAAADLVRDGAASGRFEVGRAARGAVLLAVVAAGLVAAGRFGVLLPEPADDTVIPPQRPRPSPPLPDRVLFEVRSDRALPWRLGTLDVYDGTAWLTPPFDASRLVAPAPSGEVAGPAVDPAETVSADFVVGALAGRALPSLANPVRVVPGANVVVDPRTQVLRAEAATSNDGRRYRVVAAAPPAGAALAAAAAPGPELREFLAVPAPPAEVADLLESLPDTDLFNRLQSARQAYYDAVTAAGAGDPIDVTPARVGQILAGQEASPYEIVAAEALLARWVGVPSRLGFGWYTGDAGDGKAVAVRPEHGATWLEAWFEGHGWVPFIGRPPRAKASLSDDRKSVDPSVRPSDRLTVFTYVPVRLDGLRQQAVVVRWWAARVVPAAVLAVAVLRVLPWARKARRRQRRRAAAGRAGPAARLSTAYAEVRDTLADLGAVGPSPTPLEALDAVAPDEEHRQLAWLVTRGLWGDLARDLGDDDATRGEQLAASVTRRLLRAQPLGRRIAAAVATTSLRSPWGHEGTGTAPVPRRRLLVAAAGAGIAVVAAVVAVTALAGPDDRGRATTAAPGAASLRPLREPVVPARLGGDVAVSRERRAERAFAAAGPSSLVSAARVYRLQRGVDVEGSLQAAVLRPEVAGRGEEVVVDVLASLGGGGFRPARFGAARGYRLTLPDQQLAIWFTPDLRGYVLLVTRRSFTQADEVFAEILATQVGRRLDGPVVPVPDPRQGLS